MAAKIVKYAYIKVIWTAPTSRALVTGYHIVHQAENDEGTVINKWSVNVGASVTEYNITHGLTAGHRYVITVRALSRHLPSPAVGPPTLTVGKATYIELIEPCNMFLTARSFFVCNMLIIANVYLFQLRPLPLSPWQSPSPPHPSPSIGPSQRERL